MVLLNRTTVAWPIRKWSKIVFSTMAGSNKSKVNVEQRMKYNPFRSSPGEAQFLETNKTGFWNLPMVEHHAHKLKGGECHLF
jgi:hypothetical protein